MKRKILSVVSLMLAGSMVLTGCSKNEEVQESEIIAVSPVSLTETVDWYVGDTFNVSQVATVTDETKVVTDMQFVDSAGNMQADFTCTNVGSYSMTVLVTFEDGTQEMATYVFNVLENGIAEDKTLPVGWEQMLNSKEYTLGRYETPNGSSLYYLKPNINVIRDSVNTEGYEEIFYNETDKVSYSMTYSKEAFSVNPTELTTNLTLGMAGTVLPSTEEEFRAAVEAGNIVPENPDITLEEYKAEIESFLASALSMYSSEESQKTVDEWNITTYTTFIDLTSNNEGVSKVFTGISASATTPDGGMLYLSINPLDNPNEREDILVDHKPEELSDPASLKLTEKEIENINTLSTEMESIKNAANLIVTDAFGFITTKDLSWWEPAEETPVQNPTPSQPNVEEPAIQEVTSTGEPVVEEVKVERNKTYAEKYPTLYTWPDQQAIYGMNPKLLVYDLLSAADSSGKVVYENCLVPIWGVNEHKFLNDMNFDSGSNNRQNASTSVNPSTSSSASSLFGNTTQSSSSTNGEGVDTTNTATLNTSFGTFEVVSSSVLTVDSSKSSKSQISIKTSDGDYYRIISTTAASIEKAKTKPMYDIENININTWQCSKGASETTPMGTITRYYVTYETNDGISNTAEYFYVIATGSGYLMIMPDTAVTTTSSTMYNICKLVREK